MSKRPDRYKSIIIVGAPGAGKGTQGAILGEIPRFFHFSMGDAFRALDTRSEIGQEFVKYSAAGELVPDELTIRFFKERADKLAALGEFKPDIDILILDGIPRNKEQAELLEKHVEILKIFHLSCPERDELKIRLRKRALKSGRLDDASDVVINHRIQTYEDTTKALFDYYPDHLRAEIDADQPPVMVLRDIVEIVVNHPEWQEFAGELGDI